MKKHAEVDETQNQIEMAIEESEHLVAQMKILELQKRSDRDGNMDKMHELYDKRQKKQEELEVVRGSHQSSQSHLENQDQQFSSSHQELNKLHQLLITLQSQNEELNRKLMDKTSNIEEGLTVLENYPLSAYQSK